MAQFIWMALFAAAIAAADQFTKYLTVSNIPLYGQAPGIDGVFHFTYVRNTGAAFSALSGMQWLFVLIFVVFTIAIVYEFFFRRLPLKPVERWCIAAIYGGGVGNLIDRVRLGYVVDMIQVDFMNFAVFNLADCFITCGCILLLAHLLLCNRDIWREEKK